jgi:hypothetical protein
LTNIADSIAFCADGKVGNGNITDRAALGALKFIYGTAAPDPPSREQAPTAKSCKADYRVMSCALEWSEIK